MRVRIEGRSDVGRRRQKNEDSFLLNQDLNLCMVADGMGGHQGGECASKLAVSTVEEVVQLLEQDPDLTLEEGINVTPGDYPDYLRYALTMASTRIFEKSHADPHLKGMGTTAVAALFRNGMAYIANIGDSRAYRLRDGNLVQITKDHSLVAEQLRAGLLSPDDARAHKMKNIITRSVGFQPTVEVDIDVLPLRVGDRYVLCSDGLSNMVKDDEIRDVVAHTRLEDVCERLIDVANSRGGDDNITVIVAEVQQLGETLPASDEPTLESE